MDISFELYKVFYYVAITLSFSQASRQLYISRGKPVYQVPGAETGAPSVSAEYQEGNSDP